MMDKKADGSFILAAANDTLEELPEVSYIVYGCDINSGALTCICSGKADISANTSTPVGEIAAQNCGLFLISWELDGVKYFNHYCSGTLPYPENYTAKVTQILKEYYCF